MLIQFATNDRADALRNLRGFYPNCVIEDTPESASHVLDLVTEGICRIPDPTMHPNGAIFPSETATEDDVSRAKKIFQSFHDAALATKKKKVVSNA